MSKSIGNTPIQNNRAGQVSESAPLSNRKAQQAGTTSPVSNLRAEQAETSSSLLSRKVQQPDASSPVVNLGTQQSEASPSIANLRTREADTSSFALNRKVEQGGASPLIANRKAQLENVSFGIRDFPPFKNLMGEPMGNIPSASHRMADLSGSFASPPISSVAQKAVLLMVEPFQFISFLEWDCRRCFDEHGTLKIKGLIAEENRLAYANLATSETWVCAKAQDEDGGEITLFNGVLTDVSVESQHQFHTMTIEVKTGTYLLDQVLHTRTFHPDDFTYQSVIETCLEGDDGQFIMQEKQSEKTGQFTVQYRETDWSFIKRLAHRLGVVIIPETRTEGKRFYLGVNHSAGSNEAPADHFTITRSISKEDSLTIHGLGVYHIKTRNIYELGQFVTLEGRRLVVNSVHSHLEGSELVHQYTLCALKHAYDSRQPYNQIKGVSLKGMVTAVERDQVQVLIHEDENKDNCGARWFDYATVYSTPDGTGWFAMPEIGDEIRLLFPDADDAWAYVSSNVHLETRGGRINPDHKSWKNKQQKEILFTPEAILITNNNGLSIELSDDQGITINSNKNISIQSDGALSMNSQNAGVSVYGDRNVAIQQGAASINIQDAIDIAGGKINMN